MRKPPLFYEMQRVKTGIMGAKAQNLHDDFIEYLSDQCTALPDMVWLCYQGRGYPETVGIK